MHGALGLGRETEIVIALAAARGRDRFPRELPRCTTGERPSIKEGRWIIHIPRTLRAGRKYVSLLSLRFRTAFDRATGLRSFDALEKFMYFCQMRSPRFLAVNILRIRVCKFNTFDMLYANVSCTFCENLLLDLIFFMYKFFVI